MAELNQAELKEISSLRQKAVEMFALAQAMFHSSLNGLMGHDIKILNQVLKDEEDITEIYDKLTALAVESSKKKSSDRSKRTIVYLVDIICAIERIGDCCVALVERIEYKIKENLLFSKTAVEEYKDLHDKVEQALSKTIAAVKNGDKKLAKRILEDEPALDALVDTYRANHIDRGSKGNLR